MRRKKYFNFFFKKIFFKKLLFLYKKKKIKKKFKQRKLKFLYFYEKKRKNIKLKILLIWIVYYKYIKIFWNFIKKIIIYFLNNLLKKKNIYKIWILAETKKVIRADLLSQFLCIRLSQNYKLGELLRNINKFYLNLLFKKFIKGYKIMCAGRFTKRQRALTTWKIFGSNSLSSLKEKIDYNLSEVILKYGKCSIKIWISIYKKPKLYYLYII